MIRAAALSLPTVPTFKVVVLASCIAAATPLAAAAQDGPGNSSRQQQAGPAVEPICNVVLRDQSGQPVASEDTLAEGGIVTANCNGRGYVLGEAGGFVAMPHRRSGAVAVVMDRENDSKVWLLSRNEEGSIVLEDLTFELSRAVGRAATSGLVDVRINLARFRATGVISAIPSGREGARPASAAELSLDRRVGGNGRGNAAAGGNAQ